MTRFAALFRLGAALVLGSCAAREPAHPLVGATPRIVSLAPSLTEIVYALGCGDRIVGDTSYDDYPAQARRLPHVADLTHVDLERFTELRATTVLALHDQEKQGSEIAKSSPSLSIRYLPNRSLVDLYADIEGVGQVCGREKEAKALSASVARGIARVASRTRGMARPRVFYLLGLPGFSVGKNSYLSDLIGLAGGVNVTGNLDEPYPNVSAEAIVALNPDVLVVAHDTPFGADVRSREPWRSINAVRNGRVVVPPNDDLIERRGPRVVEGLVWLAKAIH